MDRATSSPLFPIACFFVICKISTVLGFSAYPTLSTARALTAAPPSWHASGLLKDGRWIASRPFTRRELALRSARATRMSLDSLDVSLLLSAIGSVPSQLWQSYTEVLSSSPLQTDGVSAALLYLLGKLSAGKIANQKQEVAWLARWMLVGLVDGLCTHSWYHYVDDLANTYTQTHLQHTAFMTVASSSVYTPLYCLGFLVVLSLLEFKGVEGSIARVKKDFPDLYKSCLTTWAPLNAIIFGLVPLEFITVTAMVLHYIYLVVIALWDSGFLSLSDLSLRGGANQGSSTGVESPVYLGMKDSSLLPSNAFLATDDLTKPEVLATNMNDQDASKV
ncbi:hypothetical protein GUITHDRAFT_148817 [Guillardia theta CCMP2712]|uniref:Uncharacterized protein n=1 Tax=Guillardia theta (strain CCMP2712) TaxID=905079 RepID=L1I7S3_GUITC|nr:hypothetical protein GUITHDRAFT_148817 [Guillardia theta CCMP2712]EKX32147.1 hypothetical protein GUITHDRAFT_148817 [Guillardia theta CCMP2712]|eukprot:XP_005819127.1 hypothetical protein GUITHDRAFT_148817 [Guillardia theta CCMP2712]